MRFRIVVVAYTLWLIAIFGALYATHSKSQTALEFALLSGLIPVGLQLLLLGVDLRGLVAPAQMWLAFLLIILLSYLANATDPQLAPRATGELPVPAAWLPIVYTLNVVFALAIATVFAGCPDRRLLRSVAALYCVLLTPFLIYTDLTGERSMWGDRLVASGLQENTWGVMGLLLCFGALALRNRPLALAGFATGTATMLAANSRENLAAVAAGLLVIGILEWRTMLKGSRLLTVLAGSCAILVIAGVLLDPYVYDAIHYVKSDVLVLDDPLRGVDSGFSGRTVVWAAAFDAWLKSPLLGVGYRMHEQFLPDEIPGHNAYLAMLADTGVVGFVWFFVLLIGSLLASLRIQDQRTRRFVVAIIVARFVGGFFDRITIDGGSFQGLIFIICCSVALADQSLRRAASLFKEPPPLAARLSLLPPGRASR